MKKTVSLLLCICLCAGLLAACGNGAGAGTSDKLKIVTTVFPVYDWIREITGEHADITMLLDSGTDLHSYQPTADDLVQLAGCDLFVYIGGESDAWTEDALQSTASDGRVALNLMEALGSLAKEEEIKEGMQASQEEEEEEEEEGPEYDEHIWLSLRNAAVLCRAIADTLSALDEANAAQYTASADAYIAQLNELDASYQAAVDNAPVKTVLFGDRFPFRYLTEDYGLDYYAAFIGCSAETEASFETVVTLAGKVDELGLRSILQIESADGSLADTIRQNTKTKDQQILTLNSMQTVTAQDVADGAKYITIMRENLPVLEKALQK